MRVEDRDYHSIAAVAPDVGKAIGKLAAHRMGGSRGLEGIAADPPPPRAIVAGHRWDPPAPNSGASWTATRSPTGG